MKAETKKEVTVILEMNEKEAKWLKALMQNPLTPHENVVEGDMREKFWRALGGGTIREGI